MAFLDQYDVAAIVAGYAQGHFLMAEDADSPLEWYFTRSRTLIPLDHRFHIPRSLRPIVHKNSFQVSINQAFGDVVQGCAARPETWISPELQEVYRMLYQAGYAHSFEAWRGDQLAGGILGITLGSAFIGESMFYAITNGSKFAMVKLVEHLRAKGFTLFDAQLPNPHLARFGAIQVSQQDYLQKLQQADPYTRRDFSLDPDPDLS